MIFSHTIEKSLVATLPTVQFEGRIITIDTASDADKVAFALSREKAIGIDTETRPAFRKGVHHNVSLLQLSTADTCFLIRLCRTGLTDSLVALLENEEITHTRQSSMSSNLILLSVLLYLLLVFR